MARPDGRLCLTCGGPAVLCARAERCVAVDVDALRPPTPNADRFTRTPSGTRSAFWAKVLATVAGWLPLLVVLRGLDTPGAPLLVFLGVPYAYVAMRATSAFWRLRNVGPETMRWLP